MIQGVANGGLQLHVGFRTDILVGFVQAYNLALSQSKDLYLQPSGSNVGCGATFFPLTDNFGDLGKSTATWANAWIHTVNTNTITELTNGTDTTVTMLTGSSGNFKINTNVKMNNGLTNSASRPVIHGTTTLSNNEIRGISSAGQSGDDGFMRLRAGGGTDNGVASVIDLSGYSNVADMNQNIVFYASDAEVMRIAGSGGNIVPGVRVSSIVYPVTDNTYDLGDSTTLRFRNVYVGTALYLPNGLGPNGILNYYEAYTASPSCSGIWATSHVGTIWITRVGDLVVCILPSITSTWTTNSHITCTGAIPTRLAPIVTIYPLINVLDGGTNVIGEALIDTSGNINIYNSVTGGSFNTAGTSGINQCTVSWTIGP